MLGGLDEGVWPPVAQTDAFLNRPMRLKLGISPPERRIGQSALRDIFAYLSDQTNSALAVYKDQPGLSALFGMVILREPVNAWRLGGCLLLILGVVLLAAA